MKTMDKIQKQLSESLPLTEEMLKNLTSKHYFSGRQKEIGDHLLFGVLETDLNTLTFITFHVEEINSIYKVSESETVGLFPRLTLIKK